MMTGRRRTGGAGRRWFRLDYPEHLTDGGRTELREYTGEWYRELVVELDRMAAEHTGSGTPELNAQSVREAAIAIPRREAPSSRAAWPSRRFDCQSAATRSTILVTVGSVATPAVTPHLHSTWQWAIFALSAAVGAAGLGMQWLTRSRCARVS